MACGWLGSALLTVIGGLAHAGDLDDPISGPEAIAIATRGATVQELTDRVDALGSAEREQLRQAVAALLVECPYNRVSFQLPIALERTASRWDGSGVEQDGRETWDRIRAGLERHVMLLDAVSGATLPAPAADSYLATLPTGVVLDRATLDRTAEPLRATRPLLDAVQPAVAAMDADTHARIDQALAAIRTALAEDWPPRADLLAWRRLLVQVEPYVHDREMRRDVRAMIESLEAYSALMC